MTERRQGPARQGAPAPGRTAGPSTVRASGRSGLPRVPAHVGVMLGLSAGMYGMILAGATGLQAATDSASAAERAPVADSLAQLIAGHDRLAASLEEARSQYGAAGAAYEELVAALADYEVRIATLASQVGSISQDAAGLPGSIATPRPIAVPAPARSTRRIAPAPAPAPTPKPPTTTTTGAS